MEKLHWTITESLQRALLVSAGILLTSPAGAEDKAGFTIQRLEGKTSTSDTNISGSVVYDTNRTNDFAGAAIGATLKLPLSKDPNASGAQANLNDFTSSWRIGTTLQLRADLTTYSSVTPGSDEQPKPQFERSIVWDVSGSWGPQEFKYFPAFAKEARSRFRHAYSAETSVTYHAHDSRLQASDRGLPKAVQLWFKLNRDWSAAKESSLVTAATDDMPAFANGDDAKVISPPKSQASINARLFFWLRVTPAGQFAIGPAVAFNATGPKGARFGPITDTEVIRMETWLYFLPKDASPENLRIGFTPTFSHYFRGSDDGKTNAPGVLFAARFSAPVYTY